MKCVRRMWGQMMLRTCRCVGAMVMARAVPGAWLAIHHDTMRAERWLLPGAWQAATAVR